MDAGTGGEANGNCAVARWVNVVPEGDAVCGPHRTGLPGVPTRYCALTPDRPGQDAVVVTGADGAWIAGAAGANAVNGAPGAAGPAFVATDAMTVGAGAGVVSQTTGNPVAALMNVRPVVVISAQISARVTRRGPSETADKGAGSGAVTAAAITCGAGPQSIGAPVVPLINPG